MKIILSSRIQKYVARISIFLITVALIAGMVGCDSTTVQYELTITSTSGGSVAEPGEGTLTYDEGTVVSLNACPDNGYDFINWTGDVDTIPDVNAASTNITMNGHYSITANFAIGIYGIYDWYDLDAIRDNPAGSYLLMNDLDSTTAGYEELASPIANQGKGWQPIIETGFVQDNPFTGTFDGQGYEIRDLFINRPDENLVGLFSFVTEGVIKGVGIVNATVTGDVFVGGLVRLNYGGTVSNSYSTGNVTGYEIVGGLTGENAGTVSNSYSSGSVTGYWSVGGLTGFNEGTVSNSYSTGSVTGNSSIGGLMAGNGGTVSNSYSTGSVTGYENVGGLVAGNPGIVSNSYSTGSVTGVRWVGGLVGRHKGTVVNCYATGDVIGEDYVAGLVGYNLEGTVSNSYSTGSVTGNNWAAGGLVGRNYGTVSNSYSTGNVTGNKNVGGLVGEDYGTVTNSFWDIETSGQATSDGGTGKTTAQMQDIATFSGAAWNITAVANPSTRNLSYIWNIVDDETYPFLSSEPVS